MVYYNTKKDFDVIYSCNNVGEMNYADSDTRKKVITIRIFREDWMIFSKVFIEL